MATAKKKTTKRKSSSKKKATRKKATRKKSASKKVTTRRKTARGKHIVEDGEERFIRTTDNPKCKLTQEIIDDFVKIVAAGNFRQTACRALGIAQWTYDSWMQAGKKQLREVTEGIRDKPLIQGRFVQALNQAEAESHIEILRDVRTSNDIRAKIWYLERRFNKQYSRNPNAHIDDETGKEIEIDPGAAILERLVDALKDQK